jgi:hypothetical protein
MCSRAIAASVLALAALLTACSGGQVSGYDMAHASTAAGPSVPATATRVAAIQDRSGWRSCSDCTGGASSTTPSSLAQHQGSPSLSGSSAQIWLGGSTPYSNVLWWNDLGADTTATQFTYDFYAIAPDPSAPEALEFDLNQSLNNTRWVFGTECSFRDTHYWRIWDAANGGHWKDTPVACAEWPANTWMHIVWRFERVGQQTHFVTLTVNEVTYKVDMWGAAEPNYPYTGVSTAFQLDGNYRQQPFSVWIDNVTVSSW